MRILKKSIVILYGFLMLFIFGAVTVNLLPQKDNPPIEPLNQTFSFLSHETDYVPLKTLYVDLVSPDVSKIYVIEDANDLYEFSLLLNGANKENYLALDYVLGNDIDYTAASSLGRLFKPVGFRSHPNPDPLLTSLENQAINPLAFQGSFDGQGFEIRNLYYEQINLSTYINTYENSLEYYAMFSSVGSSGEVKNLGLRNPIIVQPIAHGIMSGASALVGSNFGTISHVYLRDHRTGSSAGFNVNGNFRLAGLVVDNYGVFQDSYVAANRIKSTNVTSNISTHVMVSQQNGTVNRLNFDQSIYLDSIHVTEPITALSTVDFQNPSHFSTQWYFNQSYPSNITTSFTYPLLKGLNSNGNTLLISSAIDLVYMSQVFDLGFGFADSSYQITNDIDMSNVSRNAYKTPITPFTGVFESALISSNHSGVLYPRSSFDNNYFTILNLNLTNGSDLGDFIGYGLFGIMTNIVRNINIVRAKISFDNLSHLPDKNYVAAGIISSYLLAPNLNTNNLSYVYVHLETELSSQILKNTYIGGLVGFSNGMIRYSLVGGTLNMGVHTENPNYLNHAVGGFVGHGGTPFSTSERIRIIDSTNQAEITGFGFTTSNHDVNTHIGGFVGIGYIDYFINLVNDGNLFSHQLHSFIGPTFMGGIIGFQIYMNTSSSRDITNNGNLTLLVNQKTTARLAAGYGVGTTTFNASGRNYRRIYNNGDLLIEQDPSITFTQTELSQMDILLAGIVMGFRFANQYFYDIINYSNFEIDISLVRSIAGVAMFNNSFFALSTGDWKLDYNNEGQSWNVLNVLERSYNYGDIHVISTQNIYHPLIKISGVVLGKNNQLRDLINFGDITVNVSHDAPTPLDSAPNADGISNPHKRFIVSGVIEHASNARRNRNLYNVGHISFFNDPSTTFNFHIYLSGIMYYNINTRNGDDMSRVDLTDHLLNDGYVTINAKVYGSTFASGIANISNGGTMISAVNTGDILNISEVAQSFESLDFVVDAAGILNHIYRNRDRILDSSNYGSIVSHAIGLYGNASAAGILNRNNRQINHIDISSNTTVQRHYTSILRHVINFGEIFAWSDKNETNSFDSPIYSISGGIVANGFLTTENVINYGNIYSKTLSGGIYGQMDMHAFSRFINPSTTNLANFVNYGQIRRMTSVNAYSFNASQGVNATLGQTSTSVQSGTNQALGAIIGHIYTGPGTWDFRLNNNNRFDPNRYNYWLSFDETANLIGALPQIAAIDNGLADDISFTLATLKLNDDSPYPFYKVKSYSLDDEPVSGSGLSGSTYSGIFHDSFYYMAQTPTSPSFVNIIHFIPTQRVNHELLERIGLDFLDPNDEAKGIYALAPRQGIGEEFLFMPDHMDFTLFNPSDGSSSWLDQTNSKGQTQRYKLEYGIKQLSKSLATNIERAQLVDNLNNPTVRINNPIIDLDEGTITFYVSQSSNAAFNPTETSTIENAFFLASEIYQDFGATFNGTTWVGTHIFNGTSYVAQTNGTHVLVPITLFSSSIPTSFYINTLLESSYTLGYRASFFYDPDDLNSSINLPATLVNSYGPYDASEEIRGINNQILDAYALHFGTIRVYAEAYVYNPLNPDADPLTFKDYKVNVIRLQPSAYTDLLNISVDGIPFDLTNPYVFSNFDARDVTINQRVDGDLGRMIFTYETINVLPDTLSPLNAPPHLSARVLDNLGNPIPTNQYNISWNNQQDLNGYDPIFNSWSIGQITYTLTVQNTMPSGEYTLEIVVEQGLSDQVLTILFSKRLSNDGEILTIQSTGFGFSNVSGDFYTLINYGLYYDSSNIAQTRILDFSNLNLISEIPAASTNTIANRPSYLTRLNISPFSTLVSVSVEINPILQLGYLREYIVTYIIRTEDNTLVERKNFITEREQNPLVIDAFKGVDRITDSINNIEFPRQENPLYNYTYQTNFFYLGNNFLNLSLNYDGLFSPVLAVDYGFAQNTNGFTLEFFETAPIGIYDVSYIYENSFTYNYGNHPFDGIEFEWFFEFNGVSFRKVGNSISKLENIAFTSDDIFVGLNTIIHPTYIDEVLYTNLLTDPTSREIILLPVLGIQYNLHIDKNSFYIVGQVANTDLSLYEPEFQLPVGATAYRFDENDELVLDLSTDFSPFDGDIEFRFIKYRIFAEDYIPEHPIFGLNFTDYYIAVQDITNNVFLTIRVIQEHALPLINTVHVSLALSENDQMKLFLSLFSRFTPLQTIGTNNTLRNTSSGRYHIFLNIPSAYDFYIKVSGVTLNTLYFDIPDSVIPRSYLIEIHIIERINEKPWGQNEIIPYTPSST